MKKSILGLMLVLACVPLAACNRQHAGNREAVHERTRGGGHGLRRACADDLQKYCASDQRGRERRDCLQSHLDQLSADCKAAVSARGAGGRHRRRDDF